VSAKTGFRHIVRIVDVDVPGELPLSWGLTWIKGVGYNFALAICRALGYDPRTRVGFLSDEDVAKIEEALRNPEKNGLPQWMLNRRKDYETGRDMHLVGADLIFYARQDIDREIKIRSWRGMRHAMGYKVRGQRTHTTGRTGVTVGVTRKRTQQQQQK